MKKNAPYRLPWILSSVVVASLHLMGSTSKQVVAHKPVVFQSKSIQLHRPVEPASSTEPRLGYDSLYQTLQLAQKGLSSQAWETAWQGYETLKQQGYYRGNARLTIVDFSQPSTRKRLYVVDLAKRRLLFHSWVAHGQNSGTLYARQFSNMAESFQSSPGFYQTGLPYFGKNGYSLKLRGLERGINDRAEERAIVMHGADYVNPRILQSQGYLGRSWGCPAVLPALNQKIIDAIRQQTCLFIYTPDARYLNRSSVLASWRQQKALLAQQNEAREPSNLPTKR